MLWLPLEYLEKSIMVNNAEISLYLILLKSKLMFFILKGLKELQNDILSIIRLRSLFYSMQVYVSLHFFPILSEN